VVEIDLFDAKMLRDIVLANIQKMRIRVIEDNTLKTTKALIVNDLALVARLSEAINGTE